MFTINIFAVAFTSALLMILICTTLLLIAAWGAFVAGGEPSAIPGWTKPWIAIPVAAGWILLIVVCMAFVGESFKKSVTFGPTDRMYYITSKGLLRTEKVNIGPYDEEALDARMPDVRLDVREPDYSIFRPGRPGFLQRDVHARNFGATARPLEENWYYVFSRHTIEGFDQETRRFIGSLSLEGFHGPDVEPQPIADTAAPRFERLYNLSRQGMLLVFSNAVFCVDLPRHELKKLFSATDDDPILSADSITGHPTEDLEVSTKKLIHVVRNGEETFTTAVQPNWFSQIGIGQTDLNQWVISNGLGIVGLNHASVYTYDRAGMILRKIDLPATPNAQRSGPVRPWWYRAGQVLPAPPAFFILINRLHGGPMTADSLVCTTMLFYLAVTFLMLQARHARKSKFAVWMFLNATLGLSGIFLIMSTYEKPQSVRCSKCGKRRLISERRCANCLAEAEGPGMEGIEIFAGAAG